MDTDGMLSEWGARLFYPIPKGKGGTGGGKLPLLTERILRAAQQLAWAPGFDEAIAAQLARDIQTAQDLAAAESPLGAMRRIQRSDLMVMGFADGVACGGVVGDRAIGGAIYAQRPVGRGAGPFPGRDRPPVAGPGRGP